MPSIPIPARFMPDGIASWIETWSKVGDAPELHLVLPTDAYLEPVAIALLAAGIARRRTLGMRTSMFAEEGSADAIGLLQSVDFFHQLGVETEGMPDAAPTRPALPLRRLGNLAIARHQAEATRAFLEKVVPPIPPNTARAVQFVFEELAANIVQHSGAPQSGFGIVMVDPVTKRIQIAFADAGVGFRESLGRNAALAGRIVDDAEAIRLALDRRASEGNTGAVGMGLLLLSTFAERMQGDLWIASGEAMIVRGVDTFEKTAGWRGAFVSLDARVPGW
jgi:anti-sigma regulatory factor (Ser/Thr protein kinase)